MGWSVLEKPAMEVYRSHDNTWTERLDQYMSKFEWFEVNCINMNILSE